MSNTMVLAEYVANFLVKNNINHVFSVTGGGAMHLNNALGKHPNLKVIYNHHEQACAIAAESYARYSGKIAAVCVTSGPGGTNAITGVMGGYLDSIPMLVISGQVRYDTTVHSTGRPMRQLGDQEFNITGTVKNMTKYAVMIIDKDTIRYHLEKALYLALHGRPGPCWIDIPLDIQNSRIDPDTLPSYDPAEDSSEIPPKVTSDTAKQIIKKIKAAKRPVIFAGSAIRLSGSHSKFMELIEKMQIPVVTAWNAHDVVYDDHPLYSGRPGSMGTRGGNYVVQNSDLVIVLGCRLNIRQISYNFKSFANRSYKIMVDIDIEELNKPTLQIDMKIHADVADFIDALDTELGDNIIKSPENWLAYCKEINKKYPAALPEYYKKNSPVNPYCFMNSLFHALPENTAAIASNGSACVISFQAAFLKKGGRLYTNSGCASMGYGLPAAIGACIYTGKPTICLEGDGSLQMNLQEIQTMVYHQLPVKLIVLNNRGYHSIRLSQSNFYGQPLVGVGPDSGVGFAPFDKLSEAFCLPYYRIESHDSMDKIIAEMLSKEGPSLTEVILDTEQPFSPKMAAIMQEDGTLITPPLENMSPPLPKEEHEQNMAISRD
ncbi:MAG: thiamine pyrophosphate-binding protein [Bacillota bacterium]|nr:thiamine pyrophosphate-binding protein [Bacillota bacterium]